MKTRKTQGYHCPPFPLLQVKANIKLTLEGLRELQRLAAEDMMEKKRRRAYDPMQ